MSQRIALLGLLEVLERVEVAQKRLSSCDINAMYKLIVIDSTLNLFQEGDISLIDAIRDLVSQQFEEQSA